MTVKDVPAREFIDAFSKHLKKGNKIKVPDVSARPTFEMRPQGLCEEPWPFVFRC